jgi:uncharacterized protein YutE (UPF0331/DUF86 family)
MTFDADIVQERLGHMHELLYFLDQAGEVTGVRLVEDSATRYAVERALTQLVDLAVSINSHMSVALRDSVPTNYRDSFDAAARADVITDELARELRQSAGLRNVLTHKYMQIDFNLVAEGAMLARDGYRRYISQVARYLMAHHASVDS